MFNEKRKRLLIKQIQEFERLRKNIEFRMNEFKQEMAKSMDNVCDTKELVIDTYGQLVILKDYYEILELYQFRLEKIDLCIAKRVNKLNKFVR